MIKWAVVRMRWGIGSQSICQSIALGHRIPINLAVNSAYLCSAQVLTSTEFPVDSIVVGLFRQLLIPNSIPQYCKSLPRNYMYMYSANQLRLRPTAQKTAKSPRIGASDSRETSGTLFAHTQPGAKVEFCNVPLKAPEILTP